MEKYIKAVELMEHPEKFTDEEMACMLEDSEIKEIYDVLCIVETSYGVDKPLSEDRVEEEWRKFALKESINTYKKGGEGWWQNKKVAIATFVAVMAAGAMALEFASLQREENNGKVVEEKTDSIKSKIEEYIENPTIVSMADVTPPDTVLFENESLEGILNRMAIRYGFTMRILNQETMKTRLFFRWETTSGKEENIRRLNNFEKINLTLENDTLIIL